MTPYWHGFLDATLLLPLAVGYGVFLRALWRSAIGYPAGNWFERWMEY